MLKDRTWFTQNTEILTTSGWIDIGSIDKIEEVIVLGEQLEKGKIIEFNKYKYKGEIKFYKSSDLEFTCKVLQTPNIWRVDKKLELPSPTSLYYEGDLYNIVTNRNNIIARSIINGSDNNDYILTTCICQSV